MELKKGESIMIDASLHLPATVLHEAFSDRSGVPPDHFELYYRGKRLEGEAALSSWGVGKDSNIEVKMRGRGGMGDQEGTQPQKREEEPSSSSAPPPSPSKVEPQRKLSQKAKEASEEGEKATTWSSVTVKSKLVSAASMTEEETKGVNDLPVAQAPLARSTPALALPEHGGTPGAEAGNEAGQGIGARVVAAANGLWCQLRDSTEVNPRNTDTAQRAAPVPGPAGAAGTAGAAGSGAGSPAQARASCAHACIRHVGMPEHRTAHCACSTRSATCFATRCAARLLPSRCKLSGCRRQKQR